MENLQHKSMKMDNPIRMNTDTLAYMGDAVYEQAVRTRLVGGGIVRVNTLHKQAVAYVRASAQADIIKSVFDELTADEQALVKRARNHKIHSKAKNADPITYKWATAFEALVGYLYLADDTARLRWMLDKAFAYVEKRRTDVK